MLEATLVTMGWAVSNWLIAGDTRPEPLGNENMTASPSGTFKTGAGLLNIAANKQEQFEKLCELIDRKELAVDPRYADREDRKQRRDELKAELESALAAKSAKEWSALFNQHGVPAGEVLSIPEVLEHPQITQRGLIKHFQSAPGSSATSPWCARDSVSPAATLSRSLRRRRSAPTLKRSLKSLDTIAPPWRN